MIIRGAIVRKATGTDKSKVSYNIHLDKEIKVGLKKLNNIVVMGNLPTGLPEGLFMEFDVPNPNKCTDCVGYSIRITDRNRSVFKGYIAKKYKDIINNEDELQEETDKFIEKFCLQMKVHQEKDCTWAEAGLIDNPYVLEDWAEADKLGKELVIQNMDFDAVLLSVNQGKSDMSMSGLTVTDERKEIVNFTTSYYTASQRLIIRSDNTEFDGVSSAADIEAILKGKDSSVKVGVQNGTTGQFYCEGDEDWGFEGFAMTTTGYKNGSLAVQDLLNGNLNYVIIDAAPAKFIAESINNLQ